MVCDFSKCFKVFHEHCIWPASFSAESTEARWVCPRHSCSICAVDESDTFHRTSESFRKCNECLVSSCNEHTFLFVGDAEKCLMCQAPSPRVQLARILSEAWSKMANHHLSLPFIRPLLSMANTPAREASDLLAILEKIRSLSYENQGDFDRDMKSLEKRCRALDLAEKHNVFAEAFGTLTLDAGRVLAKHNTKLRGLEATIKKMSPGAGGDYLGVCQGGPLGLQGHRVGSSLPDLTPQRSLRSWSEYIIDPPTGVSSESNPD